MRKSTATRLYEKFKTVINKSADNATNANELNAIFRHIVQQDRYQDLPEKYKNKLQLIMEIELKHKTRIDKLKAEYL